MSQEYSIIKSFQFAIEGIKTALKKEPNLRIHTILALLVLVAAFLLGFNQTEWLILLVVIFLVFVFELLNTAFEAMVDLLSPEKSQIAKLTKDVAAAAVFLAAILSVAIGLVLFLPKILRLFS